MVTDHSVLAKHGALEIELLIMLRALPLVFALLSAPVDAMEISGPAVLTDGDTLAIGGQVIRLHGIDAFENGQDCTKRGRSYNCGAESENALRKMIGGRDVSCVGSDFDDYSRLIAICDAGAGDLSAAMVRAGHGLAYVEYSSAYVIEEGEARDARRGAWAGTFTAPWEFRANGWANAAQQAPDGRCPIKGNINGKRERIYHAPWSRSYKRTKINIAKGERWFCSEAEAVAAGWRAPFR